MFVYRYYPKYNGIEIVRYLGSETDIKIPKYINNKKVVSIGSRVFKFKNLKSVKLPDGIKEIKEQAFFSNELKEIIIPHGVRKIGKFAFCFNRIKKVFFPESLIEIEDHSFASNKIKIIEIPLGVKNLGGRFLIDNPLECIVISGAVKLITPLAFHPSFKKFVIRGEKINPDIMRVIDFIQGSGETFVDERIKRKLEARPDLDLEKITFLPESGIENYIKLLRIL